MFLQFVDFYGIIYLSKPIKCDKYDQQLNSNNFFEPVS